MDERVLNTYQPWCIHRPRLTLLMAKSGLDGKTSFRSLMSLSWGQSSTEGFVTRDRKTAELDTPGHAEAVMWTCRKARRRHLVANSSFP